MANEIMHERARGQHLSIPMEDMDPEVVKVGVSMPEWRTLIAGRESHGVCQLLPQVPER